MYCKENLKNNVKEDDRISMIVQHDGIEIICLPESACCECEESPVLLDDLTECPLGCEYCSGDCIYYNE